MGTIDTFTPETNFKLLKRSSVYDFLYKKMFLCLQSIWVWVTTYLLHLLKFVTNNIFRVHALDSIKKEDLNSHILLREEEEEEEEASQIASNLFDDEEEHENGIASNFLEPEVELEPEVIDNEDKETVPKFSFKFQFQAYDDTRRSNEGLYEESVLPEKAIATDTNTSKYQFLPRRNLSGFVEKPQAVNFTVEQLYVDMNEEFFHDKEEILDNGFVSDKILLQSDSEIEANVNEIVNDSHNEEFSEKSESVVVSEVDHFSEKDQLVLGGNSFSRVEIPDDNKVQIILDEELSEFESDSESYNFGDNVSGTDHTIDSSSDEFLIARRDEIETMIDFDEKKLKSLGENQTSEVLQSDGSEDRNEEVTGTSDEPSFVQRQTTGSLSTNMNEKIELVEDVEESHFEILRNLVSGFLTEKDLGETMSEAKPEQSSVDMPYTNDYSGKLRETNVQNSSCSGSEDSNELETLWEHQDLIEQLKLELRKVRATGLPTILEESESPKVDEDLKPWKIDEKFLHEDQIDELHKFYKIYLERMRKFDILNYQKMYAIGFLQLKDPLQTISSKKSATPTLTSVFSQNLRLSRRRKPEADSSAKFVKELNNDLEMVYVGQLCLSWEFLHWQYLKARELLESDPYETRKYNQVAGEFQQFQVFLQRFIENEPFQGPRVQNYIKNRCVLRSLLQVPVIKEDPRDKEGRQRTKDAITCSMLLIIIEQSMRIFTEFIRADKNASNVVFKGFLGGPQVELLDPADSELFLDVQTNLQKKERKLKELTRIGNCIIRKFQKHHEERQSQVLLFSQVDLKLVSRVLNMSKITKDQLVWCSQKLRKITLIDRKIYTEASFLPFPC